MVNDKELGRRLVGGWTLLQWSVNSVDQSGPGQAAVYPFGQRPSGLLIYAVHGFMSATVSAQERPALPKDASPRRLPEATLAQAFNSFFHYCGVWQVRGGQVAHRITQALNPNMVGTEQLRQPEFDGPKLTLTGEEVFGATRRIHTIVWQQATAGENP